VLYCIMCDWSGVNGEWTDGVIHGVVCVRVSLVSGDTGVNGEWTDGVSDAVSRVCVRDALVSGVTGSHA